MNSDCQNKMKFDIKRTLETLEIFKLDGNFSNVKQNF